MATKKSAAKKQSDPTFFEKLSEQASQVKEKFIKEKNHLAQVAGEAVDAVKEKIHDLRTNKQAPKKQVPAKKATAKPVKKAAAKPVKKAVKKVAKKAVRKASPEVVKKAESPAAKKKSK